MKSKLSFLMSIVLVLNLIFTIPVFGVTMPNIYKDNINVRVGSTVNVAFTYGDSATSAEIVLSNLKIDAVIEGSNLKITGLTEGVAYITMNFNDGSSDSIKVNVTNTYSTTDDNYIEVKKGNSKNIYIDLDLYNASKATVSYDSDYISVNKSSFTYSGNLKITSKKVGSTYLRVTYNSGETVYYDVTIKTNISSDYSDFDLDIGEYVTVYIDLDNYDASKATIIYDSSCVSLNKTSFTSSGTLKITAKAKGFTEIQVKYNTGDVEYIDVFVNRDEGHTNYDYEEYLEIKMGEIQDYYIDFRTYNAKKATVTCDSNVTLNKSVFDSSGTLNIMGISRGTGDIKIKYDTGDVVYLSTNVVRNTSSREEPNVSMSEIIIEKDETISLYVYLGNCSRANFSINNTNASVGSSSIYSSGYVTIKGKTKGSSDLKITFSDGTKFIVPITVTYENYREPTVVLSENILLKGEKAVLELYSGSENSSVTVTLSNTDNLKMNLYNFSKYTKTYNISMPINKTKEIELSAISTEGDTEITIKYPEGKTYNFILSVVKSRAVETEGKDRTGKNFVLKENVSLNDVVLKNGYITGYADGTFGPLNQITREEFGVILARVLSPKREIEDSDYFSDVVASWSKDSIAKLGAMGILDSNELYRPYDYITRYEVADMLYSALDLSSYATTCPLKDISNSEQDKRMAQCYNAGIINGYPDGTFGGKNTITRAEVVVMINRIFYSNIETTKYNRFKDIKEGYWAYQDILKASQN